MRFIWVTRGRTWGFRFLADGGFADPLPVYERAFSDIGEEAEVCRRDGDDILLRFGDPEGRRDRAGRVIVHEFIVFGPLDEAIETVDDGLRLVWQSPGVSERYAQVWDEVEPPPVDVR